jgi:hypothetical protein
MINVEIQSTNKIKLSESPNPIVLLQISNEVNMF